MYKTLAIFAAFVFLYSIVSKRLEKTPFNGAIIYTMFGLACGSFGLGILKLNIDGEDIRTLAELTLALVLFTDAANANLDVLKQNFRLPQRLLIIGLPLTIALGFGIGVLVFDQLSLMEIAILSTMLAPTDAALGKAVVMDKSVPSNMREALNVESGLNDGICVPILFVFIALAKDVGQGATSSLVLALFAEELGIGIAVGVVLTVLGSWLLKRFSDRDWITETWRQLPVPALAVVCFAMAQWLGGSGFIATFVGGLLFGALAKNHKHLFLPAAEGIGDTLALLTWVVFGAVVIGLVKGGFTWDVILYSLLSLTLIRMLPVFLALSGLKMRTDEKLFIGWFGPRGLASVVFGVLVVNESLPGNSIIVSTVVCTIVLSIIAHGLSANFFIAMLKVRRNTSS